VACPLLFEVSGVAFWVDVWMSTASHASKGYAALAGGSFMGAEYEFVS